MRRSERSVALSLRDLRQEAGRRVAVVMTVAALVWAPLAGMAQEPVQPPTGASASPQFEVVSIKRHDPNDHRSNIQMTDDAYTATNIGVAFLVLGAYGVDVLGMPDVPGIPASLRDARFDVRAKMDAETIASLKKDSREQRSDARNAMVRALLEDRFKLKAHVVTKEEPIYELVLAKGGAKMEEVSPAAGGAGATAQGVPGKFGSMRMNFGELTAQGIGVDQLVFSLQGVVKRKIVNQTGLTGKYNFTLKWSGEEQSGAASPEPGPSIFTALQEELGLKLESARGPVKSVVVDDVEWPSED